MIYLDSFLLKSNKDNEPKRASVAKATVLIKLSTEVKPVLGNSLALDACLGDSFCFVTLLVCCDLLSLTAWLLLSDFADATSLTGVWTLFCSWAVCAVLTVCAVCALVWSFVVSVLTTLVEWLSSTLLVVVTVGLTFSTLGWTGLVCSVGVLVWAGFGWTGLTLFGFLCVS